MDPWNVMHSRLTLCIQVTSFWVNWVFTQPGYPQLRTCENNCIFLYFFNHIFGSDYMCFHIEWSHRKCAYIFTLIICLSEFQTSGFLLYLKQISSTEFLLGMHTFNFNCFFDGFNCIFTQIRCLSRLLLTPWYRQCTFPSFLYQTGRKNQSVHKGLKKLL